MWRIIISTTLLYILIVDCRPMDRIEGPLWTNDLNSISTEDLFRDEPETYRQRGYQQNEIFNSNADADYALVLPKFAQAKRALTMMARWGPFGNIGRQRTPIRSNLIEPESSINTQTRARMPGQPLRWG